MALVGRQPFMNRPQCHLRYLLLDVRGADGNSTATASVSNPALELELRVEHGLLQGLKWVQLM